MAADTGLEAMSLVALHLALTRCIQFGAIRNPAWIAAHYGSR
jgi:hypothetical protein